MVLYHGTPEEFDKPSLLQCKPHRDFGCGFYLAQNYIDALPMAIKNSNSGYVMTYELVDMEGLAVREFDGYSDDWLDFVVASRLGFSSNYDLVIGNMAGGGSNLKSKFSKLRNANVPTKLAAVIMQPELIGTDLGVQYALLTPKALSKLKLLDVELIEKECFA